MFERPFSRSTQTRASSVASFSVLCLCPTPNGILWDWPAPRRPVLHRTCERLLSIEASYCGDNSAWACNELGLHYAEGLVVEADAELGERYFARACELRFQPACVNLVDPGTNARAEPRSLDLRLLLREGGLNLMQAPESELYLRACDHGWRFACDPRLGSAPTGGEPPSGVA